MRAGQSFVHEGETNRLGVNGSENVRTAFSLSRFVSTMYLVLPVLIVSAEVMAIMNDLDSSSGAANKSCQRGCKAPVPQELAAESICVLHFIVSVESACHDMRREAAMDLTTPTRRREIESYVKTTALKLSDVATSSTRLPDDLKKRILTTLLTLMNLQESVDRSRTRPLAPRPPQRVLEPATMAATLRG